MSLPVELWLDSTSKDRALLLNVLNAAIAKAEQEIPELDIRTENVLVPSDAPTILWRFILVQGSLDRVTKTLAYWYRFFADQKGILPDKAKSVLAQEMAARSGKPDSAPAPRKIIIPFQKKKWWEFWKKF